MDMKLKQRLVGAIIVLALVVIFLPMIFHKTLEKKVAVHKIIPPEAPKPKINQDEGRDINSRTVSEAPSNGNLNSDSQESKEYFNEQTSKTKPNETNTESVLEDHHSGQMVSSEQEVNDGKIGVNTQQNLQVKQSDSKAGSDIKENIEAPLSQDYKKVTEQNLESKKEVTDLGENKLPANNVNATNENIKTTTKDNVVDDNHALIQAQDDGVVVTGSEEDDIKIGDDGFIEQEDIDDVEDQYEDNPSIADALKEKQDTNNKIVKQVKKAHQLKYKKEMLPEHYKPVPIRSGNANSHNAAVEESSLQVKQRLDQAKANNQAWIVQLGSFASANNAQALTNKLQAKGFAVFSREFAKPGAKKAYRVYVGPFVKRDQAKIVLARLVKEAKVREGIIIKFNVLDSI